MAKTQGKGPQAIEEMTVEQRSAEIDVLLARIIELKRYNAFVPEYRDQASKEEIMGLLVAKLCDWSSDIFKVFLSALEDANFSSDMEAVELLAAKYSDE